jgi:hypothetical protein
MNVSAGWEDAFLFSLYGVSNLPIPLFSFAAVNPPDCEKRGILPLAKAKMREGWEDLMRMSFIIS